jgi:pentatricopeptide repeat protein
MKGYTKIKDLSKATELFNQMKNGECKPNLVTYNTYLTCAMKNQNLELGK